MTTPSLSQLANAIRFLSMDAVQQANSGHPGMPMGMADIATVLVREFLRHNPKNPKWFNRDRWMLSNGHGSMLQYSVLHLTGYDLGIEDLKQFRQLHSKTPGHPEHGHTVGIETTTGPLGQGLANAVGMALAESVLAAQFNQADAAIVDHYTYVFLGDGCLMEGLSHEACSLAGTWKLGKLIAFWDNNGISIDGKVKGWFTDNTPERFRAYGWHVVADVDGHDPASIRAAILEAQAQHEQPTLICCRTHIACGSPHLADSSHAHGAPLGAEEIAATRVALQWPYPAFVIPDDIYQAWDATAKGAADEAAWRAQFDRYQQQWPDSAREFMRRQVGLLPESFTRHMQDFIEQTQRQAPNIASRKASQLALSAAAQVLPEFFGGSADLTGSNLTNWPECQTVDFDTKQGNYLHYGVREFGMAATMNGMSLHGGLIPFGGTFLTFSDYMRNGIRMAAIMQIRVIFVLTHDSIGVGEDGPTHEPVEHMAMLRLTPQLSVWRPCDATETAVAWKLAIERHAAPTCLALSRQNLVTQPRTTQQMEAIARGGYVLLDSDTTPDLILIATGSEVELAMQAAKTLSAQALTVRVVSMPSTDVFNAQTQDYRDSVLLPNVTHRIAIEAAAADFWWQYVGLQGRIIGMRGYGLSAPAPLIYETLAITVEAVCAAAMEMCG